MLPKVDSGGLDLASLGATAAVLLSALSPTVGVFVFAANFMVQTQSWLDEGTPEQERQAQLPNLIQQCAQTLKAAHHRIGQLGQAHSWLIREEVESTVAARVAARHPWRQALPCED